MAKDDSETKEGLIRKLMMVKELTRADQPDPRAKHILRVIHFEFRPKLGSIGTGITSRHGRSRTNLSFLNASQSRIMVKREGATEVSGTASNPKTDDNYEELILVTELTTTGSMREYLRKI